MARNEDVRIWGMPVSLQPLANPLGIPAYHHIAMCMWPCLSLAHPSQEGDGHQLAQLN